MKGERKLPGEIGGGSAFGRFRNRTVLELEEAPTLDEPMLVLDLSEDSGPNLWLVELELDLKMESGGLQVGLEEMSSRKTERGVRL